MIVGNGVIAVRELSHRNLLMNTSLQLQYAYFLLLSYYFMARYLETLLYFLLAEPRYRVEVGRSFLCFDLGRLSACLYNLAQTYYNNIYFI